MKALPDFSSMYCENCIILEFPQKRGIEPTVIIAMLRQERHTKMKKWRQRHRLLRGAPPAVFDGGLHGISCYWLLAPRHGGSAQSAVVARPIAWWLIPQQRWKKYWSSALSLRYDDQYTVISSVIVDNFSTAIYWIIFLVKTGQKECKTHRVMICLNLLQHK